MRALLLALVLLVTGFLVGTGFRVRPAPSPPPAGDGGTPVASWLRLSPDDQLLAFTGVAANRRQAGRMVLNLRSGQEEIALTPRGWQDSLIEWSRDGCCLLFEREKIPAVAAEAQAGLYRERLRDHRGSLTPAARGTPVPLSQGLAPAGEKVIAGFWSPRGDLLLRTRREPKALYLADAAGQVRLLDRAERTFFQSRAVVENGRQVVYVVRDLPGQPDSCALFRLEGSMHRQLTPPLQGVAWAYVEEQGRWMVVSREGEDNDWEWTLYRLNDGKAHLVQRAGVPGDVVAVYWGAGGKWILGAGGGSLWIVEIPSLRAIRLGHRQDWNADDAVWFHRRPAIIASAAGRLWEVEVPSGRTRALWRFPVTPWWD